VLIFGLSLSPIYPWEGAFILSVLFAMLPFIISRYVEKNWSIPKWHYFIYFIVCVVVYFSYQDFKLSVHSVDRSYYLWDHYYHLDIYFTGSIIVDQGFHNQIPYTAESEIISRFVKRTIPYVFSTFIISTIVFWFLESRKKSYEYLCITKWLKRTS